MLPSGSAAGAPALQLPSLSVQLPAAAAGLSAGQRTIVHPTVQVYLTSKQDGMTCLVKRLSCVSVQMWRGCGH